MALTNLVASLNLGPRSALVVVDVQNDFAHPDGSLYVNEGDQIVPLVNELVSATQAVGGAVFYTQDWHPHDTPHFVDGGGIWPRHCVRDTWGAHFHAALDVQGPIVQKGTNGEDGYSGFTMRDDKTGAEIPTPLHGLLQEAESDHAIVVGLALDVCVKATAKDAAANGYRVSVVEDACRAVEIQPGDGTRAVAEMLALGIEIV